MYANYCTPMNKMYAYEDTHQMQPKLFAFFHPVFLTVIHWLDLLGKRESE